MSGRGFAGTILRVDLTGCKITREPLDRVMAERYIGGLGVCIKLCHDTIKPGCDALSPNPIVLGAGPLVGYKSAFHVPRLLGFQAPFQSHHWLVWRRWVHFRRYA